MKNGCACIDVKGMNRNLLHEATAPSPRRQWHCVTYMNRMGLALPAHLQNSTSARIQPPHAPCAWTMCSRCAVPFLRKIREVRQQIKGGDASTFTGVGKM